ncbi:hypothetical protein YC2023_073353 [Brassica napus]
MECFIDMLMSNKAMGLERVAQQHSEANSEARQDEVKNRTKQSNGSEMVKEKMATYNRFDTLSRLVHDESPDRLSYKHLIPHYKTPLMQAWQSFPLSDQSSGERITSNKAMGLERVAQQHSEANSEARQDEVKNRTKQSNGSEMVKEKMATYNRFDTLSRLVHDESPDRLSVQD